MAGPLPLTPTKAPVILLAHGARDPRWSQPFEDIRSRMVTMDPERPVVLAYLEFMAPAFGEAVDTLVAEGAGSIHLVPLFLGAGGHVRKDVPLLLEAARQRHPGLTITIHPGIGEWMPVLQAMAVEALARVQTIDETPDQASSSADSA
jgi:sirohydrochlorin cobaltochelatase